MLAAKARVALRPARRHLDPEFHERGGSGCGQIGEIAGKDGSLRGRVEVSFQTIHRLEHPGHGRAGQSRVGGEDMERVVGFIDEGPLRGREIGKGGRRGAQSGRGSSERRR